jgi:hypothetical protein
MAVTGLIMSIPLSVRVSAIIVLVLVGVVASAMLMGAAGVSGGHQMGDVGMERMDHNGGEPGPEVPSEPTPAHPSQRAH